MKHRNSPDLVIFVLLLAVACVALAVPVALLDPRWLLPPAALAGWALGCSLTPLSGPSVPLWAALAG